MRIARIVASLSKKLMLALLADQHMAKVVCAFCNFLVRIPVCVFQSCSSACLVSAYIVALFQCFQMVPVSCSSGGVNKYVPPKTTPLSHEVRLNHPQTTTSLHEAVRSCTLKHWISIVDSLFYKTAGKVGTYSFLFVGKRL